MAWREESDTMGPVRIARDAYYGPQTQRALDNFPISGTRLPASFIQPLALLKGCAARVNRNLGLLAPDLADAIQQAAGEVTNGRLDDQFPVDVFQTGSGTSTNMNMNEVLARRANEILTGRPQGVSPVHPNDHVNRGQSSNDVIPSVLHMAVHLQLNADLVPAADRLRAELVRKAVDFADVVKIGRTHLQDAVPMTLGQEFSGYARQMEQALERIRGTYPHLAELALGGTAVGTGLNADPRFAPHVIARLAEHTGIPFREAANHFAAQASQDAAVHASAALRGLAVTLSKIANDIRWLGSGPRCGLGELRLAALQPGSSIMPGKVNPVIPEAVLQVAAQVLGNDATVALGGQGGVFELNLMLPVIAANLLQSVRLLAAACRVLADKCVAPLAADRDACARNVERSLALVTALVPRLGYDRAAALAKEAHANGQTIREVVLAKKLIDPEELTTLLTP